MLLNNHMKTIEVIYRENLEILIDEYGGVRSLGEHIGKSYAQISQWKNASKDSKTGKPRVISRDTAIFLEEICGKPSGWMNTNHSTDLYSNTSAAPSVKGEVPVISWVQAGTWNEAIDCERQEDLKYLPCISNHSECSFALRVRGDSMTAPYGKTYPEGCIIFVDPEIRMPSSGDRIIAKVNGEAEVTFKVFMKEGEKIWLKPLNSQHPIITDEFKVLGKVIGKWEDD